MPKYGILDEECEGDGYVGEEDMYFKRFLFSSMRLFKEKKFASSHAKVNQLSNELEQRKNNARAEMMQKLQEKKRKHQEAFVPKAAALPTSPKCSEEERARLESAWLREYNHPSCTAAITAEGVLEPISQQSEPPKTAKFPVTFDSPSPMPPIVKSEMKPPTSFMASSPGLNALQQKLQLKQQQPQQQQQKSPLAVQQKQEQQPVEDVHHHDESKHRRTSSATSSSAPFDLPNMSNLSMESVFHTSSVFGDVASPSSQGESSTPIQRGNKFDLTNLMAGQRLSFGTAITSTPLPKEQGVSATEKASLFGAPWPSTDAVKMAAPTSEKDAQSSAQRKLFASSKQIEGKPLNHMPTLEEESVVPNSSSATTKDSEKLSTDTKPEESVKTTGVEKKQESYLDFYKAEMAFASKSFEARDLYEKCSPKDRTILKRTIIEKLSITAKKLAPKDVILRASMFLALLLKGDEKEGFNDTVISIKDDKDAKQYAYCLIAQHCLTMVELDEQLLPVVADILIRICLVHQKFECIILGVLMNASELLALQADKSCEFVSKVCRAKMSSNDHAFIMTRQKTAIRLFVILHTLNQGKLKIFTAANLWRLLDYMLTKPPVVLSTPIIMNSVLELGKDCLAVAYGKKFDTAMVKLQKELLPLLEDLLMKDPIRQDANEAAHITVLRNTIDFTL